MLMSSPPEQGQLVDVRQRRFVVTDVRRASLPNDALREPAPPMQHLVTLSSVEDDGLGEELQVIWEIEPGAHAYEKIELPEPTGFDDPERLDAFLDAVRWGAASTADGRTITAPFRSGIELEDYQLDPVVRAIQMPRVNLLVADDVGLGKTIEAGLVVQELLLRHRARRVLVVCPSSLQIQWRDQMRDKFGLEFRIVDSGAMRELRRRRGIHVNPWTHFPRLITSIDYLKRERPLRLLRETLPAVGEPQYPRRYDLLIVDEAHNVAPPGGGHYAIDSLRTAAIRLLAPHFEHKLFLSATPHNGYQESFTALLELLDSQRFARGIAPDPGQLHAIMVRRLKSELPPKWDGSPRFPERVLEAITVPYTDAERRAHAALRDYTDLRSKGASDETERYATEFVLKLLKKRLFSSPAAFLSTLEQHERSLASARRRTPSHAARPNVSILRRHVDLLDEEFADDTAYDEATADLVTSTTALFRPLTSGEHALIDEMRDWASKAAGRPDTKAAELLKWLRSTIKPVGEWSDARVLIFTEYRATQKWLFNLLANKGFASDDRLMTIYGGMDSMERERVKAAFQAGPDVSPVRILLATDAASEGLDLQNYCSRLIHYEIPWNPNRMEQRNGRVDRHGQKAKKVSIYHFVGAGFDKTAAMADVRPGDLDGDLEFLMRAALKVNTIREDLGRVGPVIAQQVEEAMLGRRRRLDTARAEREAEPVRRLLRFTRQLNEQIGKLREQLDETRHELRLSPEHVVTATRIALELANQPALVPTRVPGLDGPAYELPPMKGSWALAREGLAHPHTGEVRPVVFDPDLARGRDDVVLVHLGHRLVQMCLRLLRAEIWSREGAKLLHRVASRVVAGDALEHPAAIAFGRLVVLGGDQHRLHEQVISAGGILREGRFARLNVGQVDAALAAMTGRAAPEAFSKRMAELWPSFAKQLHTALEARIADRTASLEKQLQQRADKEAADLTAIMTELRESIRRELSASTAQAQLELFSSAECEQFDRNVGSLRARAEELPAEIERETAAIRARYADPAPRLFPLAVMFLVPERMTKGGRI
jgi:superfamily II DNA or RNA helicase